MSLVGTSPRLKFSTEFQRQIELKHTTIPLLRALNTERDATAAIAIADFLPSPAPSSPDLHTSFACISKASPVFATRSSSESHRRAGSVYTTSASVRTPPRTKSTQKAPRPTIFGPRQRQHRANTSQKLSQTSKAARAGHASSSTHPMMTRRQRKIERRTVELWELGNSGHAISTRYRGLG